MIDEDLIARYRGERRIVEMMKFSLDQLNEIYVLQKNQLEKLAESLIDMERFVYNHFGEDLDLEHLAKHGEFLDEKLLEMYRKRMFDHCKALKLEL